MLIYAVLVIGAALVSVSLWELKRFREESGREMEDLKAIKKEIYQAKNDVEKLLVELNKASDRAVHEMVQKIENLRNHIPAVMEPAEEEAVAAVEDEELAGQIAIEFAGVEPYQVPEKHMAVYELAEQGLTPTEIAQKIKMGKGEVALILNLRGRGGQNDVQILQ